jgi:GNAT superfamily N-acetyltransferase
LSILIRHATPSDAERISEIADSVQGLHAYALPLTFQAESGASLPNAHISELLASADDYLWVAQTGEMPDGYVYAEFQRRPATLVKHASERFYIHQMGVLPIARGRGLGSALLETVREFARDAGITDLALDVWAFNADARAFYERHGFTVMRHELWSRSTQ